VKRPAIRGIKRVAASGLALAMSLEDRQNARSAALLLLERSVAMGHGRLALLRLAGAARVGADIPVASWSHCRKAAASEPHLAPKPKRSWLYLTKVRLV
jgi:hypothetical protein